jgi:hypothetical protein
VNLQVLAVFFCLLFFLFETFFLQGICQKTENQKKNYWDGFDNLHSNYECTSYWLCELQEAEQEKQKL